MFDTMRYDNGIWEYNLNIEFRAQFLWRNGQSFDFNSLSNHIKSPYYNKDNKDK